MVDTNWTLTTYTAGQWEVLVGDFATLDKPINVETVRAVNTSGVSVNVQIRIADGAGNNVATLVPATAVAAGEALEVPSIGKFVLRDDQELEVQADGTGIEYSAHGSY